VVLTQGEHDPSNTLRFSPGRNGAQGHLQSDISDKLDVEMDQKRTFRIVRAMSAIPPKADIDRCPCHVSFGPISDKVHCSNSTSVLLQVIANFRQ